MQSSREKGMEESTVIATGKIHLSNSPAIYGTHIRSQILQLQLQVSLDYKKKK